MKVNEWDRTKQVTLTTGQTITVRAVPPFLTMRVARRFPIPEPPRITIKSKLPGAVTEVMEQPEDPEYVKAVAELINKRAEAIDDVVWLYSLPDIEPATDDSWKLDVELADPEMTWRDGERGYRLDYIQYVLLANRADYNTVREAMDELSNTKAPTASLMAAAEESFRPETEQDSVKEA